MNKLAALLTIASLGLQAAGMCILGGFNFVMGEMIVVCAVAAIWITYKSFKIMLTGEE